MGGSQVRVEAVLFSEAAAGGKSFGPVDLRVLGAEAAKEQEGLQVVGSDG